MQNYLLPVKVDRAKEQWPSFYLLRLFRRSEKREKIKRVVLGVTKLLLQQWRNMAFSLLKGEDLYTQDKTNEDLLQEEEKLKKRIFFFLVS